MGTDLAARIAVQSDPSKRPALTLRQQIEGMAPQFQMAMPRGLEATQLVRDALTCLSRTPKLAECDMPSVMGGLMTCAQLGLRPAVLGQAWLLPMYDRKMGGQRATLVIGYQGYLELIYRSQRVAKIGARKIRENDEYEVRYGDDERLKHKPLLFGERGEVVAYYATATTIPKATTFTIMTREEMEAHRDKYAMAKTRSGEIIGPWRDEFDQMALKTVLLKLSKYLPKSSEMANAVAVDGGVRVDVTPKVDPAEVTETIEGEIVDETNEPVDPWAAAESSAKELAREAGYEADGE